MRSFMFAVTIGLSVITLPGCGSSSKDSKKTMEVRDVPIDIMKVAKDKLPGVTFDAAWKMSNGNFEVRGKDRTGKVREIDIRPDGTVDEIQ